MCGHIKFNRQKFESGLRVCILTKKKCEHVNHMAVIFVFAEVIVHYGDVVLIATLLFFPAIKLSHTKARKKY